jgi:tetratricopeptide (TPR) repeat protein
LVNQLGYGMLRSRTESEKVKALTYFILNTENFPKSYNAFDSLGEAYETLGDSKNALINYKKSLELKSDNSHARMKIENLQRGKQ